MRTRILYDCPVCKMKVKISPLITREYVHITVSVGIHCRRRLFYFHIKCFKEQLEKCESLKKILFNEKQKQSPIESTDSKLTVNEIKELEKGLGIK